ncbi:Non-hem dioxygenase N-terminal domain [Dillenia turbinata]|uniref:Non-hem dioxygenase N-terminal domain n=1 Tax=Dillenia turbinata TaxID=194707 RepID=A0AAN8ZEQ7_9MAGN
MGLTYASYPPLFRPLETQTQDTFEPENSAKQIPNSSDPLPLIDLQCLDPEKLREACTDWGIFRLVNHGIPPTLLEKLQEHTRTIFSIPFESKKALFKSPLLGYFWGTPLLTQSAVALSRGTNNIDWVEGFSVPLSQLSELQPQDSVIASFRLILEEYKEHLSRLATTLFKAMAKDLNLDLSRHNTYLSESTGFLRLYRYPQCSMADQNWGMEVHTDSSVLSILLQDEVGGLEAVKDNKWFNVDPIPNSLIVNIGDMMQAMSNDEYKSATHRVNLNKHKDRISICYFVFPADAHVILSSKYKPFTYNDFRAQVQEDTKNLGFKVGLDRFKVLHD